MTTLDRRPNTALLVIDMQNDVLAQAHAREAVTTAVSQLVMRARREGVPVVWIQHSDEDLVEGSEGWQLVPALSLDEGEPLVGKHYRDAFEGTELESVLSRLGVGRLIVAGAQTDFCIRSTLHGAFARGYDAVLVSDAHTTEDNTLSGSPPPGDVIAHTNFYWHTQKAHGRTAGTATAGEVRFAPG